MPPASSYRPLRPAIKAPLPLRDDSEPPPTSKRKREMVAVACNNCRSRKIACDGKRPLCGQCARRRPMAPRACGYRDKHETHAALRRRVEALQAEVMAHESTLSLLLSLPDDEALRLLHHLKSTRAPVPPRGPPPQQNDGDPPPPQAPQQLPFSSSASPLPDSAGAPLGHPHHDTDDGDGVDEDGDGDDGTENCPANLIPAADAVALSLPTTNPPFDGLWPQSPLHAFVYPPPMSDTGEYPYPYEDGLSALGRLPTTPTAESDIQWGGLYLK